MTLCALHAAAVLSPNCCADFGRSFPRKVMSHSHGGPGVTAPLQTNIVPFTAVWNPPSVTPPLRKPPRHNNSKLHVLGKRMQRSQVIPRTWLHVPVHLEETMPSTAHFGGQKITANFSCEHSCLRTLRIMDVRTKNVDVCVK